MKRLKEFITNWWKIGALVCTGGMAVLIAIYDGKWSSTSTFALLLGLGLCVLIYVVLAIKDTKKSKRGT